MGYNRATFPALPRSRTGHSPCLVGLVLSTRGSYMNSSHITIAARPTAQSSPLQPVASSFSHRLPTSSPTTSLTISPQLNRDLEDALAVVGERRYLGDATSPAAAATKTAVAISGRRPQRVPTAHHSTFYRLSPRVDPCCIDALLRLPCSQAAVRLRRYGRRISRHWEPTLQ